MYVTPETCYKTSFTIQLEGQRLDEFTDFASVRGLKDDSTLKLVEGTLSRRMSKVHKDFHFCLVVCTYLSSAC